MCVVPACGYMLLCVHEEIWKGYWGVSLSLFTYSFWGHVSAWTWGLHFLSYFWTTSPSNTPVSVHLVTWMLRSKSGPYDCSASIFTHRTFLPVSGFLNMEHLLFESWLIFSIVTECCHVVLLVWVVHSHNSMEQEFVMSNIKLCVSFDWHSRLGWLFTLVPQLHFSLYFVHFAKCPGLVLVAVIKYHDKSGLGEEKV